MAGMWIDRLISTLVLKIFLLANKQLYVFQVLNYSYLCFWQLTKINMFTLKY